MNNFNQTILENLKVEAKELDFKIKKSRTDENWGTYKNIIICYSEILKLIEKYEDNVNDEEVDIVDIIVKKYYDDEYIGLTELLNLIKEKCEITDVFNISPNQEWIYYTLLSKCIFTILKLKIKNGFRATYKSFNFDEDMVFNIYGNNSFKVSDKPFNRGIQRFYNDKLEIKGNKAKLTFYQSIPSILSGSFDIIQLIKQMTLGYEEYISDKISELKKESTEKDVEFSNMKLVVGTQGKPIFEKKKDSNEYTDVSLIIGIAITK